MVVNESREQVSEKYVYLSIWLTRLGFEENNVFVISTSDLEVVGVLRGLARGERIYSARVIGRILYLVTFRQVDPLFAIDLSDPTKPRVLGYIKSPGFSEYLHPISDTLLVGIGRENEYLKISLYDVSDPTSIKEVSTIKIKYAWTPVFNNHHAFTIDTRYNRFYIPVTTWYKGSYRGIAVITYTNNTLELVKILGHESAMRTIYVNEKLYTISHHQVKVYDRETLELLKTINLEQVGEEQVITESTVAYR